MGNEIALAMKSLPPILHLRERIFGRAGKRNFEGCLSIYNIHGLPPKVIFTILIYKKSFKVTCYNYSKFTSVRHFLGFVAKLERYSQLNKIIEYLNGLSPDLNCELISCSNFLSDVNDISDEVVDGKSRKIKFLCEQMKLNTFEKHGERYVHHTM